MLRRPSDSRTQTDQSPQPNPQTDPQSNPEGQPGDENDETIKLEATLVNIALLVSDRSGRYIPQLGEQDFVIYEDGVQQEVASFGSEEVPFNVVLLLDVSPSVQGNLEEIQDAAMEFVRQMRSQDKLMIAMFDRSTTFLTDFTSNRRMLENAIRSTMTGSGTSVYDAVVQTVDQRLRHVEGRKALILFSDGEDTTSSQASYDDAVNLVTESDVLVYGLRYPGGNGGNVRIDPFPRTRIPDIPFPIPFPWPWPRRRRGNFSDSNLINRAASANATAAAQRRGNRDFMTDITAAAGCPVYDAEKISDLRQLASRIAEELRHVYVVSYYPTNPLSNGGFRSVKVRVKGRDNIAVRHRRGYNAREAGGRTRT